MKNANLRLETRYHGRVNGLVEFFALYDWVSARVVGPG